LAWVAKDNVRQGRAVQRPIRLDYLLAIEFDNVPPRRFPWLNDLSGEGIGIDNHRATCLEQLGHGALAGRDAARESDQKHAGR